MRPRPTTERTAINQGKGSPYSIAERRVPELIPVLGSHKLGGRLPLLFARPAVTLATLMGSDLNPGPSAPESSRLTTRLPSHP